MPYFNIQNLIDKYDIPVDTKKVCLAINGERNIGKTTSMLKYFFDEKGVSENQKIAFIRNQDIQRETFVKDFNSRMKNRYKISGEFIYQLYEHTYTNKEGETVVMYKTGAHVGYCAAITTFLTMKSIESADLRWIVFDEYNEDSTVKDVYVKFINLFTTFERNNQIFFLMMGNRDTPNNEFMVNWEILPQESIPKEDVVYKLMDNENWFHMFIELGTDQFKDLENDKTLSYYLSTYNKQAMEYRSGGYANPIHFRVVPYSKVIKHRPHTINWGFVLNEKMYGFIEWYKDDTDVPFYAVIGNDDIVKELDKGEYNVYSFDFLGYQEGKAIPINAKAMMEMLTKLLILHRKNLLYFDSYTLLEEMKTRWNISTILFNHKKI